MGSVYALFGAIGLLLLLIATVYAILLIPYILAQLVVGGLVCMGISYGLWEIERVSK